MSDYQWLKVRILQYLMFKGDWYNQRAKEATRRLQCSKHLSVADYTDIYNDLHNAELFDKIQREIVGLL